MNNNESIKQHSNEWHEIRNKILTASSDVCDILGLSEYGGSIKKVILKKCGQRDSLPQFNGNIFTDHGIRYEKVANQIYCMMYDKKVEDMGLKIHTSIPFLGASPDGITHDNRMLEIKCPLMRKVGGPIKIGYFVQMQVQMEVFNIDTCDFFECNIKTISNYDEWVSASGIKGIIGDKIESNSSGTYYYPDLMSPDDQITWLKSQGLSEDEFIYWKLEKSSLQVVHRDKEWWINNKVSEKITDAYDKIKYFNELFNMDKTKAHEELNALTM